MGGGEHSRRVQPLTRVSVMWQQVTAAVFCGVK